MNDEIASLSHDNTENDLELRVKVLHEYNEIRDTGQLLLGKLAESSGLTTKDMYSRFSLNVDD